MRGGAIPSKYTCDGENISPPLIIKSPLEGVGSFALIMEDPDVPKNIRPDGLWVHWVVWNIPKDTREIGEGDKTLGVRGVSTRGVNEYGGPCPPDGEHRYFFKLYALNKVLDLKEGASKDELIQTMSKYVMDKAVLMGVYEREK